MINLPLGGLRGIESINWFCNAIDKMVDAQWNVLQSQPCSVNSPWPEYPKENPVEVKIRAGMFYQI